MDLDQIARDLEALQHGLQSRAEPIRERLAAMGPIGLYALAADEQRRCDDAVDLGTKLTHRRAAMAAEMLADQATAVGR